MQEYIDVDRYIPSINKKCSELSFALESDHYSLGDTLQSIEDAKAEQSPFLLKDPFKEEQLHPFSEFYGTVCKNSRELSMALSAGNPNINISTLVGKFSVNTTLESQVESEKYGFSIVTKIQCLTKVVTLKDGASMTPEALQLIQKQDWPTFYNRYGDYYVSQVFKGSLLKLTIKVAGSHKGIDMNDYVGFSATTPGKTPMVPVSLRGYLHKLSEKYSLDYSLERIGGPEFEGTGPAPDGLKPITTVPDTPSLPPAALPKPDHPHPHPHANPSTPASPSTPAPSTPVDPNANTSTSGTAATPATSATSAAPSTPSTPSTAPIPSGSSSSAPATPASPPVHEPHANHPEKPKPKPKPTETRTGVLNKEKSDKDLNSLLDYCTKFCLNTNDTNEAVIRAVFSSYRIPGLTQELFPMKKHYDEVCEEVCDYLTVQRALIKAKSKIGIPEKSLEADGFLLQINEVIRALKGIYDTIGPWQCQPLATVREELKSMLKTRYKTPQEWEDTVNKFLLDLNFNGLKHKSHFCLKYVGTSKDAKGERLYLGPSCPKDFEIWELDKKIQHLDDKWAPTVRYDDENNLTIELLDSDNHAVHLIEDGSRVHILSNEQCLGHHKYLSSDIVWDDDKLNAESKWTIHTTGEKKPQIDYGDIITISSHKKEYLSPGKNIHGVHKVDMASKAHYWMVCKPRHLPRDHSKV